MGTTKVVLLVELGEDLKCFIKTPARAIEYTQCTKAKRERCKIAFFGPKFPYPVRLYDPAVLFGSAR